MKKLVLLSAILTLVFAGCESSQKKINAEKNPDLVSAAEKGDKAQTKKALDEGADPNAKNSKGWSSLMITAAFWSNFT